MAVAEGVVDRLVYVGADGYTVAILTTGERSETKIAGTVLHGLQPGETVRVDGDWTTSGTLRVGECERVLPATVHAIRRYLGSGLVRGIGRKLADANQDAGQAWNVFFSQLHWPVDAGGAVITTRRPSSTLVKVSPHRRLA